MNNINLKKNLELLKFTPYGEMGAMCGYCEDVEIIAIEHPLKGLSLTFTYIGKRNSSQLEEFVPKNATIQDIAKVIADAVEQIHPELKNKT